MDMTDISNIHVKRRQGKNTLISGRVSAKEKYRILQDSRQSQCQKDFNQFVCILVMIITVKSKWSLHLGEISQAFSTLLQKVSLCRTTIKDIFSPRNIGSGSNPFRHLEKSAVLQEVWLGSIVFFFLFYSILEWGTKSPRML